MDYFIMKTDNRLCRLPQIQFPQEIFETENSKTFIVYVKENNGLTIEYADYLEKPGPLIAEKFHHILQKYQHDVVFRRIMLVEKDTGQQTPYYLMFPPEIMCADRNETKCDAGGNVRDFVLNTEKVGKRAIFCAKDFNRQLVVRLDVAESILRREANGIWFEPVKVSGGSR